MRDGGLKDVLCGLEVGVWQTNSGGEPVSGGAERVEGKLDGWDVLPLAVNGLGEVVSDLGGEEGESGAEGNGTVSQQGSGEGCEVEGDETGWTEGIDGLGAGIGGWGGRWTRLEKLLKLPELMLGLGGAIGG